MTPFYKGYDDTLQDVAHYSLIHDFFARVRQFRRTCSLCGAVVRLVLCYGDREIALCEGCGEETRYA